MKSLSNPSYTPIPHPPSGYTSFSSFYPFYLGEHSHPSNRLLHLLGTSASLSFNLRVLLSLVPRLAQALPERAQLAVYGNERVHRVLAALWLPGRTMGLYAAGAVVVGYAAAWVGHFLVEHNRPATFKYPVWSLRGDMKMLYEIVTFQRSLYGA